MAVTETDKYPRTYTTQVVNRIQWDWTSDASGNATDSTDIEVAGTLGRVVFVPGSGGSQPTDLYDVTVTGPNGIDVLSGQGANLSQSTTSEICPGIKLYDGTTTSTVPRLINDVLTLNVSNAGVSKSGTVILYFR